MYVANVNAIAANAVNRLILISPDAVSSSQYHDVTDQLLATSGVATGVSGGDNRVQLGKLQRQPCDYPQRRS
jgi:hypothetical protein